MPRYPRITRRPVRSRSATGVLGAHFGRMQLRIFFTQLLTRLPELELDGPPVRLSSNFINGITHLPLRWTPAHA